MLKLHVEQIEHPDFLEIVCSGDHVLEDWEELIHLIDQKWQRGDKKAVLVDTLNLSFSIENMTRYHIGLRVAEKLGPTAKIAALAPPEHLNFFWETVAHNRGANVRAASDRDALVAWLSEKD